MANKVVRRLWEAVNVNGLSHGVGYLCVWFGVSHVAIGLASIIDPSLYANSAYDWVTGILSIRTWGFLMLLNGLLLLWSGIKRKTEIARAGLVVYFSIQWLFGLSILLLTFDGSHGAFAGAIQWWTGPVVCFIVLMRPVKSHHSLSEDINSVDAAAE